MDTKRRSNVAYYCSKSSQNIARSLRNFMMQPWTSFLLQTTLRYDYMQQYFQNEVQLISPQMGIGPCLPPAKLTWQHGRVADGSS